MATTDARPGVAARAPAQRCLTVRGRQIPVILPNRRDPRLRLSAVITALHVLGQTVLGFKVSIAQILACLVFSAVVEIVVTFRRDGVLAWPASAMLTGNSVAFILRASGTRHGDWWTLHGVQYFLLAALVSLLSKYLIRPGGRHLFNPSNVGIVWCLLVIGPAHVFPQYLWWGPLGVPVALAYAVILLGGPWVMRPVRMGAMAASFLVPFAALIGIFAATGHTFVAIWHAGAIRGASYWADIVLSPELLVFVFFMMSDPQTAPKDRVGRVVYGAGTAVVAAALLYPQNTEFGVKLAILSSLTLVCAVVPLIEAVRRRAVAAGGEQAPRQPLAPRGWWRRPTAVLTPAVLAALIVATTAPAGTLALAGNKQVLYIERGLTGKRNPQ